MTVSESAQRSALADLCVYAVGHEIAAIKLCGHAAAQCTDRTGRMLLVDMALERIEAVTQLELAHEGLAVSLPRLDPAELQRLLALRQRPGRATPHPRPTLRKLRLVGDLLLALRGFDAQAELLLRSMSGLLPEGSARQIARTLHRSKVRWIRLTDEVGAYLDQLGQLGEPIGPVAATGAEATPAGGWCVDRRG